MTRLLEALRQRLAERAAAHLLRERQTLESPQGPYVVVHGRKLVNFCSNDYLGLANDPRLKRAMAEAVAAWGVGSGASHLICGHMKPHAELEAAFADFTGLEAALCFSTGYMANLAVITSLVGRGDAVFADRLNHASLNDGCLLSRADFHRFPHNDLDALARQLATSNAQNKLIAVDAVYSMDGDLAPLDQLLALAERHDAWLYVDDAHGFGVLGEDGRGSLSHWQVKSDRLIYLATLGKAAGVSGAMVAAARPVIDWLVNTARPYIYTTAMPPAVAAAAAASLRLVAQAAHTRAWLHDAADQLRARRMACRPHPSACPVIHVFLQPDSQTTLGLQRQMADAGFLVGAIRPPTVSTPRLRITLCRDQPVELLADALFA